MLSMITKQISRTYKMRNIDTILNLVSTLDDSLKRNIIHMFYSLHNSTKLKTTIKNKKQLNLDIQKAFISYRLKRPLRFHKACYNIITSDTTPHYAIKIDHGKHFIIEIYNKDRSSTTLAQFLFFVKTLLRFLINRFEIIMSSHELQRLFLKTPIRSFQVLYYLFEARNRYSLSKPFTIEHYCDYVMEFIKKRGFDININRLEYNTFIFGMN